MFKRTKRLILGTAVATVVLGSTAALAAHQFTDVPNSSPWHDTVDYIADRSITGGCGGGNYCPNDSVTRGQMSAFMERLSRTLTPQVTATDRFYTNSAVPQYNGDEICVITTPALSTYEKQVEVDWSMSVRTGDEADYVGGVAAYSTDGGTSWQNMPAVNPFSIQYHPGADNTGGNTWASVSGNGAMALTPGTSYTFAITVRALGNTPGGSDFTYCGLTTTVGNRMPGQAVATLAVPSAATSTVAGE